MFHSDSEKRAKFSKLSRSQYVLRFGVFGWGIPTAILFALIQSYRLGSDGFLFQLIPALIIFPLGGILFGRIMWWMMERMAKAAETRAK
jgi:hypothetical protein